MTTKHRLTTISSAKSMVHTQARYNPYTMYYSFYKRVQTNAAFVAKHKHWRANLRRDITHTMYYSSYKRVQTNDAFLAKHKHGRANLGVIQAILCITRFINVGRQMLHLW